MERKDLWKLSLVVAFLSMLAGLCGMVLSGLALASGEELEVMAGVSGFIASAILIGSGLIGCSVIAASSTHGFGDRA